MEASLAGMVGPVLGVVRCTQRDRCLHRRGPDVPANIWGASVEHLPGLHGSAGHVDATLYAAASPRSSAADGTDRRQVLAYRWLGSDCVRRLAKHGAENQVQRGGPMCGQLRPRQDSQVSQEEIQRHAAEEERKK